nr:NAD(P)-dependent oxidoreductase [uncultured Rhodoferax sp.]
MRIAILGATSQIAQDLVCSVGSDAEWEFCLYSRRSNAVAKWLEDQSLANLALVGDFSEFEKTSTPYDAVINFVGSGNPAQTERIGAAIMDVTYDFDDLVIRYLKHHPLSRYIFFSSGAVYGGGFASPAHDQTNSVLPINHLGAQDWYGVAKMYAEARHRALSDLQIVDLRVFNYFSYSADIEARFLITDTLRSIRDGQVLQTSQENIFRDYVGPNEIAQLIRRILRAPPKNAAVDCFTREPIDKISMLERMRSEFGLRYDLVEHRTGLVATGSKLNYYSKSRKAADLFGYAPEATSLELVVEQSRRLLSRL